MPKSPTSTIAVRLSLAMATALALNLGLATQASALPLDCTASCNLVSYSGALWATVNTQSTGTGVINSFVRIQGAPDAAVDGHNTDGAASNNELNGHLFARQLGVVPILNIGGTLYYEFLLDINQEKSDPLLALNNVQICQSSIATLTQVDACPTAPDYTMGTFGGGPNYVKLDYELNAGSGSGDLLMYIPVSTLGTNMTNYIYLFSQFGAISGYENNDGFEEWATRICGETYGKGANAFVLTCATPGTPDPHGVVPEPGSLLLLGTGLAGLVAYARKRKSIS